MPSASNEPVAIGGLINTAIVSTIGILLYFKVDPLLVGQLSIAASGWVAAITTYVRSKVTPTKNVALTHDQAAELTPLPGA